MSLFLTLCLLVRVGGFVITEGSVFLVDLNKSRAISSRGRPRVTSTHRPHTLARRLKSISEPDSPQDGDGFELLVPLSVARLLRVVKSREVGADASGVDAKIAAPMARRGAHVDATSPVRPGTR